MARKKLNVAALYDEAGEYRFTNGFSMVGIGAFVLAVLPNLPGFLATVGALDKARVPGVFLTIYNYAWFVGFALAFGIYLVLRKFALEPMQKTSSHP